MHDALVSEALKPQPRISSVTRPFWDAVNERRLLVQRCVSDGCRKAFFYPRVCCPHCQAADPVWEAASGKGRIVSHTTIHRVHHDGFLAEAPYVFAAVEIAEGPCLYAQIPGAPLTGTSLIGRTVSVDFVEHGPGRLMPVFRLDDHTEAPAAARPDA